MRILTVCLGNICRSPLAQGILEKQSGEFDLDWVVDSAGTAGWNVGQAPDPRSVAIAAENGIDISGQRARLFSGYDFEHFDLILVMDKGNYRDVIRQSLHARERQKVKLIMDLVHPGQGVEVPDPYYDTSGFQQVFTMLETACKALLKEA